MILLLQVTKKVLITFLVRTKNLLCIYSKVFLIQAYYYIFFCLLKSSGYVYVNISIAGSAIRFGS